MSALLCLYGFGITYSEQPCRPRNGIEHDKTLAMSQYKVKQVDDAYTSMDEEACLEYINGKTGKGYDQLAMASSGDAYIMMLEQVFAGVVTMDKVMEGDEVTDGVCCVGNFQKLKDSFSRLGVAASHKFMSEKMCHDMMNGVVEAHVSFIQWYKKFLDENENTDKIETEVVENVRTYSQFTEAKQKYADAKYEAKQAQKHYETLKRRNTVLICGCLKWTHNQVQVKSARKIAEEKNAEAKRAARAFLSQPTIFL